MKNALIGTALAFVIVAGSSAVALADPVYFLGQIQIENADDYFGKYAPAAGMTLQDTSAKVLVASPTVTQLEGDWVGNWTVVIEFASEKEATDWYNSNEYQNNARPSRLAATSKSNLLFAPAFAGLPAE